MQRRKLKAALHCAKNRERTNVSLVYFNQLAASMLGRRYAGRIEFLLKQTKVALVRVRFYAQWRPGLRYALEKFAPNPIRAKPIFIKAHAYKSDAVFLLLS